MLKDSVTKTLSELGIPQLTNTECLARKLRINPMAIRMAHEEHRLDVIDKHSIKFEAIVDWLSREPQYMANALNDERDCHPEAKSRKKSFLAAITTYSSPAFIDLNLQCLGPFRNDCDIIVIDDASGDTRLASVCNSHGVPLLSNPRRYGHLAGDLIMTALAIEYANNNCYEYILKISRRWICLQNPIPPLEKLINASHGYTFSNNTVSWGFGFRTEFLCLKSSPWAANVPIMRDKAEHATGKIFVEGYIHKLAQKTQPLDDNAYISYVDAHPVPTAQSGYIHNPWMGTDRRELPPYILWHDVHTPGDYWRYAMARGLRWMPKEFLISLDKGLASHATYPA